MTLYDWWKKKGTQAAQEAAKTAGISYGHFKNIAHKRARAGYDTALDIQKATSPQVTIRSMVFPISEKKLVGKEKAAA
jgi:hypothetical protein